MWQYKIGKCSKVFRYWVTRSKVKVLENAVNFHVEGFLACPGLCLTRTNIEASMC